MTRTANRTVYVAELVALYDAQGFKAASRRCGEIADGLGLTDSERLSLADAFRRFVILR